MLFIFFIFLINIIISKYLLMFICSTFDLQDSTSTARYNEHNIGRKLGDNTCGFDLNYLLVLGQYLYL